MIQKRGHDLYKVLELDVKASTDQIKKSFYLKLKEIGGPERNPEKYQLIREAYDTLYNPTSRAEYDALFKYGEEINELIDESEDILYSENPDYNVAARKLKKAVSLGPKIARIRSLLCDAFIGLEDYDSALTQATKANEIDDANARYWCQLGLVFERKENYSDAIKSYQRAVKIDPHIPSNNIALAYCHFYSDQKDEALQILDNAIYADGTVDFKDFSYFYHKINMMFIDGKASDSKEVFDKVIKVAKKPEDKSYAAWMFMKFSHQLYEYKLYNLMAILTANAVKLQPENKEYQELHEYTKKNNILVNRFDKLSNDKRIDPILVELVRAYFAEFGGYIDDNEYKKQIDEIGVYFSRSLSTYPDGKKILDSINILRDEYSNLYELNYTFFDKFINQRLTYLKFRGHCPNCRDSFVVDYGQYAIYTCPHCNHAVEYDSYGYRKYSQNDCFVATAVYSDHKHKNLVLLRNYRDEHLGKYWMGRIFINVYYKIGPIIAKFVKASAPLKKLFQLFIEKLILPFINNK